MHARLLMSIFVIIDYYRQVAMRDNFIARPFFRATPCYIGYFKQLWRLLKIKASKGSVNCSETKASVPGAANKLGE